MTVCYSLCYNVLYGVLMRGDGGNSSLPLDGGHVDEWHQTGSLSSLIYCTVPTPCPYPMTTDLSITTLSTSRAE